MYAKLSSMNTNLEVGSVFKICSSGSGSGRVHKEVKESIEERYMRYKSQFTEETPIASEEEDAQEEEETGDIKESTPIVKKKSVVASTSDQHQGNPRMSKKERADIKKNKKKLAKAENS